MRTSSLERLFFWHKRQGTPSVNPSSTIVAPPAPQISTTTTAPQDPLVAPAKRFVHLIREALPTLEFVMVGETASGRVLASTASAETFNAQTMSLLASDIIRCERVALGSFSDGQDEVVEDVLVSLASQWHLIKMINNEKHYIYLSITSSDVSLAIARALLVEYARLLVC